MNYYDIDESDIMQFKQIKDKLIQFSTHIDAPKYKVLFDSDYKGDKNFFTLYTVGATHSFNSFKKSDVKYINPKLADNAIIIDYVNSLGY